MFADQLDVGFLDDPVALHRAIGVPTTGAKSIDFSFLDNELFSAGAELDDTCGVFSESEDYSRMLYEWQQHIGLLGSDLVDFDDPLSASCFKDGQFVPAFSDKAGTTNSKDIAALEADDLDSLLAQFEASQAADWLLNDCITPVEPPANKAQDAFSWGVLPEEPADNHVLEEIIVEADDEAEYIDVEEIGEEEVVEWKPADSALIDQRVVDLDHDYCIVFSAANSEVDIEADNSEDGLYNKIPSYYHETALLRGNICLSPCPEDVTEEIIVDDDSPASPIVVNPAGDSGLYCRLPPYIAECLPTGGKLDAAGEVTVKVLKLDSPVHSEVDARVVLPSVTTGRLQSLLRRDVGAVKVTPVVEKEDVEPNDGMEEDDEVSDRMSVASDVPDDSIHDDNLTTEQMPESPKTYGADDEYCRYYERMSRERHRHHRKRHTKFNRHSSSRSPTRSRSSRSRSSSSSSSKSRSWSRSRSRNSSRSRSGSRSSHSYSSRSSSQWEDKEERLREWRRNKMRPIEERRIIYVGNISSGTTRHDLRRRFSAFGPIEDVTVHFREQGDDYGFVTFLYKVDAFEALAHGNDDRSQPQYDLCFGGRRHFCQSRYADLDGLNAVEQDAFPSPRPAAVKKPVESDFDAMLRAAQASRKSNLQKGHS